MATDQTATLAHPGAGETEIASFTLRPDSTGRVLALKLRHMDGTLETLLLPLAVVAHLRATLLATLRARPGLEVLPVDTHFFERLPAWTRGDWVLSEPHVHAVEGCGIETRPDACRLAFPLADGGERRCVLRPLQAGYLLHALNDAIENEGLGTAEG